MRTMRHLRFLKFRTKSLPSCPKISTLTLMIQPKTAPPQPFCQSIPDSSITKNIHLPPIILTYSLPTTPPSLSIAMDSQHANPDLYSMLTYKEEAAGYPMCTLSLGPASRDDDGAGSIISMPATVAAACEGSGSNSSGALPMPPAKRLRTESAAASGASSARFKGVVLQQNGHWGAQIYAHHSRIWLGTFKTERAAALAYDSAATKLHRGDAHRNFPTTTSTELAERGFQNMFSTEAVLDMIRDGSYEPRLTEYLWTARRPPRGITEAAPPVAGVACRELFQKELTPSDVGKLNRLVIPKKYATKCLPAVSEQAAEEVVVDFVDQESRMWAFRYCYWKSSQSYVFTKGWNKFVKEKQLKAKDVVAFYHCEEREGLRREYRMIDVLRDQGGAGDEGMAIGLGREVVDEEEGEGEVISGSMAATTTAEGKAAKKPLMLFGVCIEEKL